MNRPNQIETADQLRRRLRSALQAAKARRTPAQTTSTGPHFQARSAARPSRASSLTPQDLGRILGGKGYPRYYLHRGPGGKPTTVTFAGGKVTGNFWVPYKPGWKIVRGRLAAGERLSSPGGVKITRGTSITTHIIDAGSGKLIGRYSRVGGKPPINPGEFSQAARDAARAARQGDYEAFLHAAGGGPRGFPRYTGPARAPINYGNLIRRGNTALGWISLGAQLHQIGSLAQALINLGNANRALNDYLKRGGHPGTPTYARLALNVLNAREHARNVNPPSDELQSQIDRGLIPDPRNGVRNNENLLRQQLTAQLDATRNTQTPPPTPRPTGRAPHKSR